MWIRSQNKISLLKAKEIRIETEMAKKYILTKELSNYKPEDVHTDIFFGENHIHSLQTEHRYYVYKSIGYIVVNDKKIARYSTEEKAMKVLDMIEKHLNSQAKIIEQSRNDYIVSDIKTTIFQMPQDEEVE